MRRVTSYSFLLFAFCLSLAVLAGCNSFSAGHNPGEPTITSFTANPTAVAAGGSTSLTGVFSNGTGVIAPGNISVTSGTAVSVSPAQTTTYILTVTNSSGVSAVQTATVTVSPLAPTIASFTANPTTITAGGTASLTGVFANGTGVITPGNITAISGSAISVTPTDTTTYTLTVTNSAGDSITQSTTVTVNPVAPAAPAITSFTASSATITAGGSTGLTGVFSGGTGVITPGNLAATSGAAVSVSPTDTTTYTLTVTNSAGVTATKTVTVTVNPVAPAAPAITSFAANPASITAGGSTNLTGVFTGGTGIITPGNLPATSGAAVSVSPTDTTTYTLTVTNSAGVTASKTATVTILTAQTITFANPGTQTVGTPLTLVATASSGLIVSFVSTTQSVCTVSGTTATFIATGTCSITASQAGNSTYAAATPVSQSFAVSGAPSSGGAPLILYTDLLSGPTSGGENNNGTYLSIFGQNFGTSGLGTTTKVFIGGVEVASYRYLGASLGRPDVQQITVQVGALSGLTQGTAYPINVQVNGVNSTSYIAQTFTPNPGRILFVSLSGNDATAAVNDINHPWGDIQASTWGSGNTSGAYGAWGAAQPGDVIVFRGGTYTMQGFNDSGNVYFCKFFYGPLGSVPTGAAGTGPIAITAYPTETVIIQPPQATTYGVFAGVNSQYYVDSNNNPTMSQWITFSNLKIVGGTEDGPISLNVMSNHWRVVNTDLSNPLSAANAGGVSGDGNYIAVLGNNIHDIGGNSSLQDHGIYIDSAANYEVAYNVISNITGGNGIQTYNSGDATEYIDNVNIHHNMIHDVAKHGINIADTSRNGFTVWSNVVYNTTDGCVRFNTTDITGAKIWNNTFYNCNANGNYAAIMNDWNLSSGAISFTNNIVWPASASGYYLGGSVGFSSGEITGNKNDWYNGTDNGDVSFDANALFMNPLFVSTSTPDFHLQSGSPALNSGDTSVSSLVTSNYDVTPLPASSGYYNRGALGSSAGALQSQTIDFANPGTQTVGTPLTLQATASSGLTVSFTSTTTSVCTVNNNTATFSAAGTCTIDANQAGNSTYAAAPMVPQSFTVDASTSSGDPTSGVLPSYNDDYANWKNAGLALVGGIPNRTTICATVNPLGGGQDDYSDIQTAIDNCPAGEVVQLAAGAFSVHLADMPIHISTGISLRGTGNCSGNTSPYCQTSITVTDGILPYQVDGFSPLCGTSSSTATDCPNGGQPEILMSPVLPDYNYSWEKCSNAGGPIGTGCGATPLAADAVQGQTTIQVASTSNFTVGSWVLIDEASGAGWQPDPMTQSTGYVNVWAAPDWLSPSGSPATGRVAWAKFDVSVDYEGDFGAASSDTYPYQANTPGCWHSYCDRPTAELHKILSIGAGPCPGTNCTVTFDDPLTIAFRESGGHNAQVYARLYGSNFSFVSPISFLEQAGVENISLLRSPEGGLEMELCVNCWVKNTEIGDWVGGGLSMEYSARSEINTVYVHHCWDSVNSGGEYPIDLGDASTEMLITNSITNFGGKGMVARSGGAGSVVSYNYIDDSMYDDNSGIGDWWLDMSVNASHEVGPHHVLFEGNWGDNLDSDNTHGNSTYITFFRNLGTGLRTPFDDPSIGSTALVDDYTGKAYYCPSGLASCVQNTPGPLRAAGPMAYSYWFAFVGNVLGVSGTTTAANGWTYSGDFSASRIFMLGWMGGNGGQDPNLDGTTASYIFINGNYDYLHNAVTWQGSPVSLPNSFYLSSKPAFFSAGSGYAWPWVTPTGSQQIQSGPSGCGGTCSGLPAQARWQAGTPFVQP